MLEVDVVVVVEAVLVVGVLVVEGQVSRLVTALDMLEFSIVSSLAVVPIDSSPDSDVQPESIGFRYFLRSVNSHVSPASLVR